MPSKKLAVRYKRRDRANEKPVTVIIELPENIRDSEDAMHDFCDDYICENMIGEHPKWLRIEGYVHIEPIK